MIGAIVRRLIEAQGQPVRVEHFHGLDPALVREAISEIEDFGYPVEFHPYQGYTLSGPSHRLCPDQIETDLPTRRLGRRIQVWQRTTSTNDLALAASDTSLNDGLVILAEEQTCGRGRRGRTWEMTSGQGILMSLLLWPPDRLREIGWLTAWAAVALAELLHDRGCPEIALKWPNDVYCHDRKLAGVLVERRADASVVGLGLNVSTGQARLSKPGSGQESRGTAERIALDEVISSRWAMDRSELVRDLLIRLETLLDESQTQGPATLGHRWAQRAWGLHRPVELRHVDGTRLVGILDRADPTWGVLIRIEKAQSSQLVHDPAEQVESIRVI